jgi:predicted peptidase
MHLPHYKHLFLKPSRTAKASPLLIFLHGIGECGPNLEDVKRHGPPKIAPYYGLDRFYILSPQCRANSDWDSARLEEFVCAAIAHLHDDDPPLDKRRIYLTGLSMGGFGVWDVSTRCPQLFAAVAIVCGGGDPELATKLQEKPIWLFHSATDKAVPIIATDTLFDELRRIDAPVTYTRYRDLEHGETWERAYGSPCLYDWFLQHTL